MNTQMTQLLTALNASEIRETDKRVNFNIDQRKQEIPKDFPLIVHVETSSYCNLVCMGCPQKDLTRPRNFMGLKLFEKIVDELVNYDVRVWFHYMGEPLMSPEIFDLIDYASEKGLKYFGMASNGMLLTKDNIERILDSGLYRFEISVDSLDPVLLGQVRPGGNPKEIIENTHEYFKIKYQRGEKYPITSINFRELKQNLDETESFIAHWRKILKEPDFILAFPYETWGGHESREHARYLVEAERLPCLKLWKKVIVLSDGRLVTCDAMFNGQVVMGDTNVSTIKEIWDGNEYHEMRQKHIDGRGGELEICDVCDSWYRETGPEDFRNLSANPPN